MEKLLKIIWSLKTEVSIERSGKNSANFSNKIIYVFHILIEIWRLNNGMTFSQFLLNESPEWKTLEKNKVPLSSEEREQVMDSGAVWHHAPNGGPSPAVWKSVVNGKEWFITNTHRLFKACPTINGAITKFHKVVKQTS
jgi:hypothetical protein